MKKLNPLAFVLSSAIVIFMGCTKADTAVEKPAAPKKASVIYSGWDTLHMNFSKADSMYEQTILADSLNQPVLESGVVLTYIRFFNPATQKIQVINAGNYLEEIFHRNTIHLRSTADFSGLNFSYFLIPGSSKNIAFARVSSVQGYPKERWQSMTYEEVLSASIQK